MSMTTYDIYGYLLILPKIVFKQFHGSNSCRMQSLADLTLLEGFQTEAAFVLLFWGRREFSRFFDNN